MLFGCAESMSEYPYILHFFIRNLHDHDWYRQTIPPMTDYTASCENRETEQDVTSDSQPVISVPGPSSSQGHTQNWVLFVNCSSDCSNFKLETGQWWARWQSLPKSPTLRRKFTPAGSWSDGHLPQRREQWKVTVTWDGARTKVHLPFLSIREWLSPGTPYFEIARLTASGLTIRSRGWYNICSSLSSYTPQQHNRTLLTWVKMLLYSAARESE